jgi:hypothetical protein
MDPAGSSSLQQPQFMGSNPNFVPLNMSGNSFNQSHYSVPGIFFHHPGAPAMNPMTTSAQSALGSREEHGI